ncbi:MAG: hypothetical protein DRR19_16115, partial [Candidatus Parabeggiatoa sp. nov. 1]
KDCFLERIYGSPVEVVMMSKQILSRGRDSICNITICLGLPDLLLNGFDVIRANRTRFAVFLYQVRLKRMII